MRRLIQTLRKDGKIVEVTQGRLTKTVIFTTTEGLTLSAISQETLAKQLMGGDITVGEAKEYEKRTDSRV